MFGRWGIERISPGAVQLTASGRARLRICGRGFGSLRVGGERRWVWGRFDESFFLSLGEHEEAIAVRLRGLGGQSQVLDASAVIDIHSAAVVATVPSVRSAIRFPETRTVVTRRIEAPRVLSLTKRSPEFQMSENEPTT